MAGVDPDALRELAGDVLKIWVVLAILGLPAQALLVSAFRSEQRQRRTIAVIGGVAVVLAAALITSVVFYSYDGTIQHTLVLWATLTLFSVPAHLLFFLAIFRLKRMLPRLAVFAGGAALMMLGAVSFGVRSLAYSLQHSLGGWP